jgi:hypothetical protein
VARIHCMHADYPNPQPLEVFTDEEDPSNSISCYIMLCMFQGDLVQQGITAKVTGHTGEKGCLRCFMLGTNTLQDGTDLRTQRWLGCYHPAEAEVLQPPPEGQVYAQVVTQTDLRFVVCDGNTITFDRDLARAIEISHEQHGIRARTALTSIKNALLQHPIPQAPPQNAPQQQIDAHRAGIVTQSSFVPNHLDAECQGAKLCAARNNE